MIAAQSNSATPKGYSVRTVAAGLAATLLFTLSAASSALAQTEETPALTPSLQLRRDVIGVAQGGLERGVRRVDTASLALDADFQTAFGWPGANARFEVLANSGGAPEALAGTLSGVNNSDAGPAAVRLYQAFVEKRMGRANVRIGLSDISSEFDVADASALLMGSSFGIGQELAAAPKGGPSVYPSTSLGARIRVDATASRYWQLALVNARPGTLGDRSGIDVAFTDGVMGVAEHGWTGAGKIAVGLWGYSRRQPALRPPASDSSPDMRARFGAYGLVETPLGGPSPQGRLFTGFLKAGVSDGRSTEIKTSWQAGVLVSRALPGRPASLATIGLGQAVLSPDARHLRRLEGQAAERGEVQLELSYADRLTKHVSVQPDLQLVWGRNGLRDQPPVLVMSLRLTAAY